MGNRDIDKLEPINEQQEPAAPAQPVAMVRETPELVEIHYPVATPLSEILHDISRWSAENFAMDPAINTKLQIFAPHPLTKKEALELFWAALSIVHLRAVRVGPVTKIVPVSGRITA